MDEFTTLTEVLNHRENILVIDLTKYYAYAKDDIAEYFKEPVKGLYIPGSPRPMFVEGETYYSDEDIKRCSPKHVDMANITYDSMVDTKLLTPVTDLNVVRNTRTTWFNSKLQMVVTKIEMARLSKILTTEPPRSADALVVASIVDRQIARRCLKTNSGKYHKALYDALKPEARNEVAADYVMRSFGELMDSVDEFIGRDVWNIYSLDLRGTSLFITKGIDWRIYDWYRMKFEEQDQKSEIARGEF